MEDDIRGTITVDSKTATAINTVALQRLGEISAKLAIVQAQRDGAMNAITVLVRENAQLRKAIDHLEGENEALQQELDDVLDAEHAV